MECRYYFVSSTLFFFVTLYFTVLHLVLQCFYLSFSSSISWYFVLLSMKLPQLYPEVFLFFCFCTYNFKNIVFWMSHFMAFEFVFIIFKFSSPSSISVSSNFNFTILAHLVLMVTCDVSTGSVFFLYIINFYYIKIYYIMNFGSLCKFI